MAHQRKTHSDYQKRQIMRMGICAGLFIVSLIAAIRARSLFVKVLFALVCLAAAAVMAIPFLLPPKKRQGTKRRKNATVEPNRNRTPVVPQEIRRHAAVRPNIDIPLDDEPREQHPQPEIRDEHFVPRQPQEEQLPVEQAQPVAVPENSAVVTTPAPVDIPSIAESVQKEALNNVIQYPAYKIKPPKHDPELWKKPDTRVVVWPGGKVVPIAEMELQESPEELAASLEKETVDELREKLAEEPIEEASEEPIEEASEEPIEEASEEPIEEVTEEPIEEAREEPIEEATEEPIEVASEEPIEEATEEPIEEVAEESIEEAPETLPEKETEDLSEDTTLGAIQWSFEEASENTTEKSIELLMNESIDESIEEPEEEPESEWLVEELPGVIYLPERLENTGETEETRLDAEQEEALPKPPSDWLYPGFDLLDQSTDAKAEDAETELRENAERLADTLKSFGVEATAGEAVRGPAVTRYEFTLERGVKLSKVTNLQDDIALALGASGVRIAPIPDKMSVVGVEVPNRVVSPVSIRSLLDSRAFLTHPSPTAFAVGKDISGHHIVGDIARFPHVLIAGTTGSGKSVCTNSLIVSILYKSTPEDVRFIMVDPKMVELAPYNGIPHLLIPVVTDPKKAAGALQWAVYEMMKRYKLFSENNVKDLAAYNKLAETNPSLQRLPSVVVVIDELADLMLIAAKEVEESICRVAQMGRASGMHLVIATQSPRADVITGLMKANIPSRIAFAVASSLESRIILDNVGAEKLVGKGDMLYAPLGAGKPQRVQGCFISAAEIERVVTFLKANGEANYDREVIEKIDQAVAEKEHPEKPAQEEAPEEELGDAMFPDAVDVILETGQASVSMLQRRLKLGYSRAARLVDQMEEMGIVGPFEGSKPRKILITRESWERRRALRETNQAEA